VYYRDANCALVVFDLCEADTFKVAKQWVKDLRRDCVKEVTIGIKKLKI
jgi:GTPase SAR1 family protein